MNLIEKVKALIFPETSEEFVKEIAAVNVKNLNIIAIIMAIVEFVGCIVVLCQLKSSETILRSGIQMSFCLLLCIIIMFITRRTLLSNNINHKAVYLCILLFFIIFSSWGMFVSYSHYINNEQILTFYTVIIVLVGFMYIKPLHGIFLTLLSFAIFYLFVWRFDKAEQVNSFNYMSFALVLSAASVSKYHIILRQLEQKKKISELNSTLENAAYHDYLTKLKNRFALMKDCEKYFGKPISVVMCDCDNFKCINDKYGHLTGDKIICAVADLLKSKTNTDFLYRYGGDEFIIITDLKDKEYIQNKISIIKKEIANIRIENISETLSVSFGTANSVVTNTEEFEKLLHEADINMYSEKNKKINNWQNR